MKNYEDDSQHGVFVWRVAYCLEFAGRRATPSGSGAFSCLPSFVLRVADRGQQMIYATLETRNFSFVVFAKSMDEAMKSLEKSWNEHTGGSEYYYTWDYLKEDVCLREVEFNTVIKD